MRSFRVGLLLLLVCPAVFGQDVDDTDASRAAEIDELEPAVSSEALTEAADEESAAGPSAPLAADVRRRASGAGVMDELDLGTTEVTGNQELPKVLYIVPWRKSDPGEVTGKPVNTLLDEVLAPIDRTEFTRQVDYYSDLYAEPDE